VLPADGRQRHTNHTDMSSKNRASTLAALGESSLKAGNLVQAESFFASALSLNPEEPKALQGMGITEAKRGNVSRAIALLEAFIQLRPKDYSGLSNLGNLYRLSGRLKDAVEKFQAALRLNGRAADTYNNLGAALIDLGRNEDAVNCLMMALKIDPKLVQARFNLGRAYRLSGKNLEAAAEYKIAVFIKPDFFEAFYELGHSLYAVGEYLHAAGAFDQASRLRPDSAEALAGRGAVFLELNHMQEARGSLERALDLYPDYAEAHNNLGRALHHFKDFSGAVEHHLEALRLRPNFSEAHNNLGVALQDLQRYEEALREFKNAVAIDPGFAGAWSNLAGVLKDLKRFNEALECYERAISIAPKDIFIYNCAITHLGVQNYMQGWAMYEHRWNTRQFKGRELFENDVPKTDLTAHARPRWTPDLSARRVLIWGEQGIGDQLLYGSLLSCAMSRFDNVTALVDRRLVGLFSRASLGVEFRPNDEPPAAGSYDAHLPLASLGQYTVKVPDDLKNRILPYIKPDPDRLDEMMRWRAQFHGYKMIGLSWRSSSPDVGHVKSISLDVLLPLLRRKDVRFVNLQYGSPELEIEKLLSDHGIEILQAPGLDVLQDLEGVAALISACDLVVSSSNSNVHLAAAMSKKVWLLAPFGSGLLWYWTPRNGRFSMWHPSVELFEQDFQLSWDCAISEMNVRLDGIDLEQPK